MENDNRVRSFLAQRGMKKGERLRPHLFDFDEAGKPARLRGDRYEFWIYRQLRKHLVSGELYLESIRMSGVSGDGRAEKR